MGSEHYCLRWNNHQSNLLGVFSQLLQDESLVDVTLACSEGAPIRAHKVVLSACSSYFQSLFLDHPERHPIVILKDVRFSELQTLVEFMYKGEVNVQYCQLSALLKTAESLKVKGLAEMTNQNTALREPEREPERLRPHSQPKPSASSADSPLNAGASTSNSSAAIHSANPHHLNSPSSTITVPSTTGVGTIGVSSASPLTSLKREPSDPCSPSPPKRIQQQSMSSSPVPLDLYQRRGGNDGSSSSSNGGVRIGSNDGTNSDLASGSAARTSLLSVTASATTSAASNASNSAANAKNNSGHSSSNNKNISDNNSGEEHQQLSQAQHQQHQLLHHHLTSPEHRLHHHHGDRNDRPPSTSLHGVGEEMEEDDEDDDEASISSNDIGLNMSINATTIASGTLAASSSTSALTSGSSGQPTVVVPSPGRSGVSASTSLVSGSTSVHQTVPTVSVMPSDLSNRPASRSGHLSDRPGSVGILTGLSSSSLTHTASTSSRISSPVVTATGSDIGEPVAGPSGLGPVQSVPLSLKKEIDWDRSEDSNRAASVGGGDLDFRHSHDSETSQSPHGLKGGSDGGGASGNNSSGGVGGSSGVGLSLDQGQTPSPIYPCVYCGATFPHQSKLTRHILSHSLETLKYRETAAHLLHPSHMLSHELPPLPQHFSSAHHRHSGILTGLEGIDPQDGSPMEMDFATAANMAVAAAANITSGCLVGTSGLSISAACSRLTGLDDNGGRGSSSAGNGGIGGSGGSGSSSGLCGSSSGLASALGGAGSSSFGSSASASTSNDPNSVVLCKFCGKSFPDVASLITHLPVHTGDRPFKCEFCGKAFKLRHHMKDHCRVHTGERPFRCHMCGKTFSRSTILKAHEKTHFPKYVRKFLSPSPVDTKDELPQ